MEMLKKLLFGKRNELDMTQGNIYRLLISFAFPYLLGQLFQQLYNTVDTWVVGNFVNNEAFAAVGSVGAIIDILIGFFSGLAGGAVVIIAQHYGGKRFEMARKAAHTYLLTTFILCVIFTAVGLALTPFLINLLNLEGNVAALAGTYLRIYFCGISGLLIYNAGAAICRAVGNSRGPFVFLALCALTNTVLDLLFVLVFDMGVAGVALATTISQILSAIMILALLFRSNSSVKLQLSSLKIDLDIFRRLFRLGIPASLQHSVTNIANLLFRSYIYYFGTDCISGWTAYSRITSFPYKFLMAIVVANSTFIAQNIGKSNVERAKKGVRASLTLAISVSVAFTVLIFAFAPPFVRFFNKTPEVVEYGTMFLRWIMPFYFLYGIECVFNSTLRSAGKPKVPLVIMLLTMVGYRLGYLSVVTNFVSNTLPWIIPALPTAWGLGTILSIVYYKKVGLTKSRIANEEKSSSAPQK